MRRPKKRMREREANMRRPKKRMRERGEYATTKEANERERRGGGVRIISSVSRTIHAVVF